MTWLDAKLVIGMMQADSVEWNSTKTMAKVATVGIITCPELPATKRIQENSKAWVTPSYCYIWVSTG